MAAHSPLSPHEGAPRSRTVHVDPSRRIFPPNSFRPIKFPVSSVGTFPYLERLRILLQIAFPLSERQLAWDLCEAGVEDHPVAMSCEGDRESAGTQAGPLLEITIARVKTLYAGFVAHH